MWYIGGIVNTCNWNKGDCLTCWLLIGKPICDFRDGGIAIGDGIANTLIVDQIVIGYFDCTFNICDCWSYNNYYDNKVILVNNHFPFVVAVNT